jgi:hypothetical protein
MNEVFLAMILADVGDMAEGPASANGLQGGFEQGQKRER